jgi:hypothetical protein
MFVEEGFRIRFANGETIDFYADSTAEKEGWMHALVEVVGKESRSSQHQKSIGLRSAPPTPNPRQSSQQATSKTSPSKRPNSSQAQYSSPRKPQHRPSQSDVNPPPPLQKDPRHMTATERRAKTRSMVF